MADLEQIIQEREEAKKRMYELFAEGMDNHSEAIKQIHETILGLTNICVIQNEQITRLENDVKELKEKLNNQEEES